MTNWDQGGAGEKAGKGRGAMMVVGGRGGGGRRRGFGIKEGIQHRGVEGLCTSIQSFAFRATSSSEQLVSATALT